jgi:hypothetical protein
MSRSALVLITLPFVVACGKTEVRGQGKPAAVASEPAEAGKARPPQPKPAARPAAADPHQETTPHQANPHASLAKEKGPPQDVTPSGATNAESIAELGLAVPTEWKKGHPRSSMRLAEFTIPGPGGDAELVVFRFAGGAGGVQANVDRWKTQFQPPEGKTIDDLTTVTERQQGDLKITLVDVKGRYVAAVMPGTEATHDEAEYRMLAAIVEGSGDPFFFKTVGPEKTLAVWNDAHEALLSSIETKP